MGNNKEGKNRGLFTESCKVGWVNNRVIIVFVSGEQKVKNIIEMVNFDMKAYFHSECATSSHKEP